MQLPGINNPSIRLIITDVICFSLAMSLGLILGVITRLILLGQLQYPTSEDNFRIVVMFVPALLIIILRSSYLGHYTRFRPFWPELNETVITVLIIAAFDAFILFVMGVFFSRLWFGFFLLLLLVLIPLGRYRTKGLLIRQNLWYQPTYIVGVGSNALKTARAIQSDLSMGYSVKGFIGPAQEIAGDLENLPIFESIEKAKEHAQTLNQSRTPTLVFAFESSTEMSKYQHILNNYIAETAWVTVVPPPLEIPLYDASVIGIFRHDTALLRLQNNLNSRSSHIIKRSTDLIFGSLILVLLFPLFILLYVLISRDGQNVFYKHKRVGFNGRKFECVKFRTMIEDQGELLSKLINTDPAAAKEWEESRKLKHDPRVTKIGHYLRRTSIDELPQLWNVLKGEMSLVGPRPVVKEELSLYGDKLPYYRSMKPGMTGLWQVSGRSETGYAERVRLDVWYCRNWSLWIDFVVLIQTIKTLIQRHGAF